MDSVEWTLDENVKPIAKLSIALKFRAAAAKVDRRHIYAHQKTTLAAAVLWLGLFAACSYTRSRPVCAVDIIIALYVEDV